MSFFLLILVIAITLIFAFSNGVNDAANAVAAVISSKALSPRSALIYGAALNFLGAFCGVQVAKTIGVGIIAAGGINQMVILSGLLGAITWNGITWFYGIPSSSSNALIGGLLGAAIAHASFHVVNISNVFYKIIVPMFASPVVGGLLTFIILSLLLKMLIKMKRATPQKANERFSKLQLLSAGFVAFSHGTNDTQKSMGVIVLALTNFYALKTFHVPFWVIITCATCMGLGTLIGGWRIIKTLGQKITKLKPIGGFAAELSSASIIMASSHFGIPVSTTQVMSGSIIGAGSAKRFSDVKWNIFGNMATAWILTIPFAMATAFGIYFILHHLSILIR